MGIGEKIGHAAEELKEKGQEAFDKVTHKNEKSSGSSGEQAMDYPRDTGGESPATGRHGESAGTWDADSRPGSGGESRTPSGGVPSARGGDATPDPDVERRDPKTDPMQVPAPNVAKNQDNTGKVNYLR
jgi:hypothetical protein